MFKKFFKSWTARLAVLVTAAGAGAAANPAWLEVLPPKYQALALAGLGVATALARFRKEILRMRED